MVIRTVAAAAGAVPPPPPKKKAVTLATTRPLTATRRQLLLASAASALPTAAASRFAEIPRSGGVKALDIRDGSGEVPADGDQVAIHYYGRLAAKQGWRFDSTYDHKDETGDPMPFVFTIGSGKLAFRKARNCAVFYASTWTRQAGCRKINESNKRRQEDIIKERRLQVTC